jgi:predicted RNase H-like HicB family nuclease
MEKMINIKVEHIRENSEEYFLATSEDVQGLIAQGSTIEETLEIAQSLVYELLEVRKELDKDFVVQNHF